MEKLGVTVRLTSGYRPQSNGPMERMNQELGRFLRSHWQDRQGEWARYVTSLLHRADCLPVCSVFSCGSGVVDPGLDRRSCGC